jgi:hypothetical protein
MFTKSVARLSALRAALMAVAMVCGVGAAAAQDTDHVPTLAEYNAVKAETAMALAQSALKDAREGKTASSSPSNSNPSSTALFQNYSQPQQAAPSAPAKPVEPTVAYVHADAKGVLVASLSDGTQKHAGESIGHGAVIQAVTLSDVTVKDGSGVHSLAWGDGATSGGIVESRAMQAPSQGQMAPGIMTLYPPQH